MLKYWLITILNTPFVLLGIYRALRSYDAKSITKLRMVLGVLFWIGVFACLVSAQAFFEFLQRNNLTDSTALSLFDVVQITGIITALYLAIRLYTKHDQLETRLNQLNRELAIKNATDESRKSRQQ